jgi:hypothetical protein
MAEQPEVKVAAPIKVKQFQDTTPSNWDIKRIEDSEDAIIATSNASGEVFEGSVAEFNRLLKGG